MAQIPLLRAGLEERGKAGESCSGSLKVGERISSIVILEIIVGGKLLRRRNAVIEAHGELITTHMPVATGYELVRIRISL